MTFLRYGQIKRRIGAKFPITKLLCSGTRKSAPVRDMDRCADESNLEGGCRSFSTPAWPNLVVYSEPIQDLVGPEPLEPVQRLVQGSEFLVRDAADLLHGLDVLLIERVDDA